MNKIIIMPLPLFFIGVAAVTGLIGIGKTVKAGLDVKEAKKVTQDANGLLRRSQNLLKKNAKMTQKSLETLGKMKLIALKGVVADFIETYSQLKNVKLNSSVGLDELKKLKIDKHEIEELKEMTNYATSILSGVAKGSLGGAIAAYGAYSAAGLLALASTGTPIASLSGIAATNATLAFFGGGSLAAGGLGIAGGSVVLGGLVAGPALAIMGFIVGAKASEEKNKAYVNLASAKRVSAEMNLASDKCKAISKRSIMFTQLLNKLTGYTRPLIEDMKVAISENGTDYMLFTEAQKSTVARCMTIIKCVKMVLDTPILTEDGNLTVASRKILEDMNLDEI